MKDYTVPLTLISILADAEFHSGEQLGERLGMSRAAINKHIQTLRDWESTYLPSRVKATVSLSLFNFWMKSRSPGRSSMAG